MEPFDLKTLVSELHSIAEYLYQSAPEGVTLCDLLEASQRIHVLTSEIKCVTQKDAA